MSFTKSGGFPNFGIFSNTQGLISFLSQSPAPPPPPSDPITGGTTTSVGGYNVHTFTSTGPNSMVVTAPVTVQILIVAGGGSPGDNGGDAGGGGGGGGGVYYTSSYTLDPGTYTVNVGAGGDIYLYGGPINGQNSNIFMESTLVLYDVPGGGHGGNAPTNYSGDGNSGGSGGGGSVDISGTGLGGTGIPPFGNNGGTCYGQLAGAGGGGAGTAGGDATYYGAHGTGGDGLPFTITGTTVYYGAGGNGGSLYGGGGTGLGGNGPNSGGGGYSVPYTSGASGIVIISEAPI